MIEYTWREAVAIMLKLRKDDSGKCRNTRLSAAVSSTCWLPLTPKSSHKDSLARGQLSCTQVFHCVSRSALVSRHLYEVCTLGLGSTRVPPKEKGNTSECSHKRAQGQ